VTAPGHDRITCLAFAFCPFHRFRGGFFTLRVILNDITDIEHLLAANTRSGFFWSEIGDVSKSSSKIESVMLNGPRRGLQIHQTVGQDLFLQVLDRTRL
jgi:hypothetical protein